MSTDPDVLVDNFLKENGYSFEMSVAQSFQKAGFGIHQSIYYSDLNTNVSREIDVVAIWSAEKFGKNFNIIFPIECKYAPKPWVLFSSITEGVPSCYTHSSLGTKWLNYLVKQPHFENFFELTSLKGHGLVAATKDKEQRDNAYSAIQQLLSFLKAETVRPRFSQSSDYNIYIPIVIVKGLLYETHLDQHSEVKFSKIEEAQLFYREDLQGIIPKIHIVTENNLSNYINRLVLDCRRIFTPPYMDLEITNPSLSNIFH